MLMGSEDCGRSKPLEWVRLVILGGPGAGKGTQAQLLCRHLDIPWIATGEIFRSAIAEQSELGRQAQPYLEKGELVPDPTTIELIRQRLLKPDALKGWLLDGYPRTAFQAEELDFLLDQSGQRVDWAIWLKLSESVLMQRCLNREASRSDDAPEIVRRRIELFEERTIPILEYYDYRDRLVTVDGDRSPQEVHQEILGRIAPQS